MPKPEWGRETWKVKKTGQYIYANSHLKVPSLFLKLPYTCVIHSKYGSSTFKSQLGAKNVAQQ